MAPINPKAACHPNAQASLPGDHPGCRHEFQPLDSYEACMSPSISHRRGHTYQPHSLGGHGARMSPPTGCRPSYHRDPQPLDGYGARVLPSKVGTKHLGAAHGQPQSTKSAYQLTAAPREIGPGHRSDSMQSSPAYTVSAVACHTLGTTPMERFLHESHREQPWNGYQGSGYSYDPRRHNTGRLIGNQQHSQGGKDGESRFSGESTRARKGSESSTE